MNKEQIIKEFYSAFNNRDHVRMVEFYSENILFEDPAFGELKNEQVSKMWEMLCKNAKDLTISCSNITINGNYASCRWNAEYTFSRTGRIVNNKINANFVFDGDQITQHKDEFNLRKWASQAFGLKGSILGGTNFFKAKLQKTTRNQLKKFIEHQ